MTTRSLKPSPAVGERPPAQPGPGSPATATTAPPRRVALPQALTVRQLALDLDLDPVEVIKQLMRHGVMATINQVLAYDVAARVARSLGFQVAPKLETPQAEAAPAYPRTAPQETDRLELRPPVVTILGHVDHGKTTLLDAIRKSNLASQEAGGITQHIGAYQVKYKDQRITFLDTPGHEAFTAMRARGARITDMAILVVAVDDGVMPQTVEAINHAKAATVPIVVALNKIDRSGADPERVKRQLAELGLLPEEWGGDTIMVPVSATKKTGIDELLENIVALAEILELKASPHAKARGAVIEARLDKSRGPVATILVQQGTLKVGETIVAGGTVGRVKALVSDLGRRVRQALPSDPVEAVGLEGLPQAGDTFDVVDDISQARELLAQRRQQREAQQAAARTLTLGEVAARAQRGEAQELSIIIKADVQGSVEPIQATLTKLSTDKAQLRVIHAAAGSITESDVLLAIASKAVVVGFSTRVEPGAKALAEKEGVEVRLYDIIYRLTEDIEKALQGLWKAEEREVVDGHAQVRAVFPLGGGRRVAGCQVSDGTLRRGGRVRVLRGGTALFTGPINSLKRFKDDVREVTTGLECGAGVEGFTDFQEGDILEAFHVEQV